MLRVLSAGRFPAFLAAQASPLMGEPEEIHADIMNLFEGKTLDFAHLEPWLRRRVEPAA